MSDPLATHLLLRAFVDELHRCGVRHAVTSPGSRSTPLVLALVRDGRLRTHSHVDERGAAFFGLGVAKATGMPAVLACTSGTAAAQYAPAVIEAWEARVPMIVLTADRPPELRELGAGQTIDQVKLFGSAAKWFFDVGTHDAATPERLRWMRQLACRAVWTTLDGRPGPVHLDVPLREPLVAPAELPPEAVGGRAGGRPWTGRTTSRRDPAPVRDWLRAQRRGVVVAGTGAPQAAPLAEALGWPLLADPLSGARHGGAVIAHYDALLRDERFAAAARPGCVLRLGDLPTSKPLRAWLTTLEGVPQAALLPHGVWHDPDATLDELFVLEPADLVAIDESWQVDAAWLGRWRSADAAAAKALDAALGDALHEPAVARTAVAALPPGATLLVAASMPVRDVETFAAPREDVTILSNRGANGIDGTIATAYGLAATGTPTAVLLGDVALAHDLGALLTGLRHDLPLTVVLVDNAGGGIFSFLPVAAATDAFEEHVATPTGLEAERVAALFGAAYRPVASVAALRDALAEGLAATAGTTLVHVRTDRAENVALHRRCWTAVAAALA